ncbi:PIG-L deacetylase family protein [Gordonia sp. NPDC003504]
MSTLSDFPEDWHTALVLVAHPDDPEYGIAAAVRRWTDEGKHVVYALASSGEKGIAGMDPAEAGPLRENEQRISAAIVGVDEVEFWGYPDSDIRNSATLRATIADAIRRIRPDLIVSLYGGTHWAPDAPNQPDHIEFSAAVREAFSALEQADRPRWLFENGPDATHAVPVSATDINSAIRALAAHRVYLEVLDPDTPVAEQARAQVDQMTAARPDYDGRRAVGFAAKLL